MYNGYPGSEGPGPNQDCCQQQQEQQAAFSKHSFQSAEGDLDALRQEDKNRRRAQAKMEAAERLATALARKEQVKAAVGAMQLPNNPLDQIIDMLGGPDQIAEMTGAISGLSTYESCIGIEVQ